MPPERRHGLFELAANPVEASPGAGFIQIAPRRTAGTDRPDHLVTDLDDDAAPEQNQVRQLGEQRGEAGYRLRPLDQGRRIGLERGSGVSLVVRTVERMAS